MKNFPRVFSESYLTEAGVLTVDLIARAIRAGNKAEASDLLARFQEEIFAMYYNYRGWEKGTIREMEERGGVAFAEAAVAKTMDANVAPERVGDFKAVIKTWPAAIEGLQASVKKADNERAIADSKALYDAALAVHDGMMSRITALLTILHDEYGDTVLQKVLQDVMKPEVMDPDGTLPFRDKVEKIILFTRVHLQPFTLTEDHEKVTFMPDPCPSGARLIREGHYEAPRNGKILADASNLTYQQKDFPIYCCHEPAMEMSSILKTGVPVFLVDPSADLGNIPCKIYIYKNPEAIPERFFSRIGLDKTKDLIAKSVD